MKTRFKSALALTLASVLFTALAGCAGASSAQSSKAAPAQSPSAGAAVSSQAASVAAGFDVNADFESIIEQARGTTVTFYGWGGDENRNKYLSGEVAEKLKKEYDLTLELVPMDIDQILAKLSGEKQAGTETGSVDMIWINGENFYSAKENDLLFGPFAQNLPSYQQYVNAEDAENQYDFGYPIEGYEAPYGKAQLVLINDSARTPETPAGTGALLEFAQKYKGQVSYPALPDFTGSAFVRNVIYDICGHEQFMDMEADKETVRAAIQPAMEYLRQLNPYLWNEGKTFPASSAEMNNMFADGELALYMSYAPFEAAQNIEDGLYPETAQTFLFDKGTIGNTNYIAIAQNAPNKAGAMVAINYILSPQGQAGQYAALHTLPVLDNTALSEEQAAAFEAVDIGQGTLTQEELLAKRLPEMPAKLVPIIEEIWLEEVVGK